MNKADREKRNKEIREFVTSGHTYPEASKKYNLCLETIRQICKGCREGYINQFVSSDFDQLANVKRYIAQSNQDMEYVSGSVSIKGHVVLRCKKCGHELIRSMETIRKGHKTNCLNCKAVSKEKEKEEKELRKKLRHEQHIQNVSKYRKLLKENTKRAQEARRHNCPVCGKSTTRPKYCSNICCSKDHFDSSSHESRRRTKIKARYVDKDITLKKLYDRDNGQCWICGLACDYDDKTYTEKAVVAGNMYPSIDHVVALSDGGAHAWDNVKLAHRICNSLRYYAPRG